MNNRITIVFTLVIVFLLIIVPTVNQVIKTREDNYILVLKNKITVSAKKCWDEGKCTENKILIKELNEKGYTSNLVNPKTKENLKEESYVLKENNQITVTIVD